MKRIAFVPLVMMASMLLGLALAGCGSGSDQEQLQPIDASHQWMIGDWHMVGTPSSLGDLGADIRQMHISNSEIWTETFGHLAAESSSFNTNGYDYGGNCLHRIHAKQFGFEPEVSQATRGPTVGQHPLAMYRDSAEYMDDPGNRSDCRKQMNRLNEVLDDESWPNQIGFAVQDQKTGDLLLCQSSDETKSDCKRYRKVR